MMPMWYSQGSHHLVGIGLFPQANQAYLIRSLFPFFAGKPIKMFFASGLVTSLKYILSSLLQFKHLIDDPF